MVGDKSPLLGTETGRLICRSSHEKLSPTDLPSKISPFITLPFSLKCESDELCQDLVQTPKTASPLSPTANQPRPEAATSTDTDFLSHPFPKLFNSFLPNWWQKQGEIHIDVTIGISKVELLLVYEYIPNGIVADHIHDHQATPEEHNMESGICAQCHMLRHYGNVKDPTVENWLPDFDFDHTVGRWLALTGGTWSVVLMVVDATDFDGSFPRKVARLVSETIEENSEVLKQGKSGNLSRMVMVVTKIDLSPTELSPTRQKSADSAASQAVSPAATPKQLRQSHNAAANAPEQLRQSHSAAARAEPEGSNSHQGIKPRATEIKQFKMCSRAQNAGKSTLINSIGKHICRRRRREDYTFDRGASAMDYIRVEGKLFDTLGLLNPHQITMRLTREEQKLVHISKELRPRTYKIKGCFFLNVSRLILYILDLFI
uniref:G domain-containing protein n=1 Tax=Quercus lobata TaxID=97700 RepID=A0A7N2KLL6_QUELO